MMQGNLEEVRPTLKDLQGFLEKKNQMETWLMSWKMCSVSLYYQAYKVRFLHLYL